MDKASVEEFVREIYAARMKGDVDAVMDHCHSGIAFSIAGSPTASPVPLFVTGIGPVREALNRLVSAFEFHDAEILNVIAEGEEAAVHWRVRVRSPATGQEAVTELVDLVRIRDGKLVSLKQFADTALAGSLLETAG